MRLVSKPSCCGSVLALYDYEWSNQCQHCQFHKECEIKALEADEQYRFEHNIP